MRRQRRLAMANGSWMHAVVEHLAQPLHAKRVGALGAPSIAALALARNVAARVTRVTNAAAACALPPTTLTLATLTPTSLKFILKSFAIDGS